MSEFGSLWYSRTLNEVDAQIARQATICKVRILDSGVIRRILDNDETVCGSRNAAAFASLRNLLMMHYQVRDQAVAALGEEQARGAGGKDRRRPARAHRRATRRLKTPQS